ncbi:transporter substrate-binding domain-containing protein [Rhizobium sp. TRM96647]|uniref:substrate-binding periplasmic protein n=1 Tax=unclassified Rhizobium TaxID=2613769 RepID=UPI0021E8E3DB|nr:MULTISPECIES: transporter substrate-binding domain-containing protein [unclassified Rhizobium]MCV3738047.1 transporter substrate-binding domain-containing protein [Rhizobium sp. TRM96647]MCV3759734.1 transporter substrate-binding domain-containing protein [Rhizobium sp. TRM96650]
MMPTKTVLGALAVLALCTSPVRPALAADITFVTEEYAPFNYSEDGTIRGIAVEQVRRIADTAGVSYRMEIMPWARALMLAEREADHCVFTTAHTSERHDRFNWVEPLLRDQMVMVRRKGSPVHAATLDEARAFRIGSQRGDIGYDVLTQMGFTGIDLATDIAITLGKLRSGRIDLMPTSVKTYDALIAEGEPIERAMLMEGQVYGIACNRNVPKTTIDALQKALDALVTGGDQDAIFARYGLPPNTRTAQR